MDSQVAYILELLATAAMSNIWADGWYSFCISSWTQSSGQQL